MKHNLITITWRNVFDFFVSVISFAYQRRNQEFFEGVDFKFFVLKILGGGGGLNPFFSRKTLAN